MSTRRTKTARASAMALATSIGLGAMAMDASANGMESYAWSKRPVVVFAATSDDERATQQLALLNAANQQNEDRDVIVLTVWPDRVDGSGSLPLDAEDLRTRYNVAKGTFAVLLIGKDTGVKRRVGGVIDPKELFGQIDSMPMRQREMQEPD